MDMCSKLCSTNPKLENENLCILPFYKMIFQEGTRLRLVLMVSGTAHRSICTAGTTVDVGGQTTSSVTDRLELTRSVPTVDDASDR
jgi:hypothetical protein